MTETMRDLVDRAYCFLGRQDYPSREQMEDYIARAAGRDVDLLTPVQRDNIVRRAAELFRAAFVAQSTSSQDEMS